MKVSYNDRMVELVGLAQEAKHAGGKDAVASTAGTGAVGARDRIEG